MKLFNTNNMDTITNIIVDNILMLNCLVYCSWSDRVSRYEISLLNVTFFAKFRLHFDG